ncbi:MAG: hypothetical protein AAF196_11915 [Planctomycetota bacterium]
MNQGPILVLRQILEAARQSTLRLVRTRLFLFFWGVAILGGVLLYAALPDEELSRERGDEFTGFVLYLLVLQFGLPLAGVHLAATSLRDDIDRGTLGIIQTRAISRATLLFGRFLGTTFVVGVSASLVLAIWFFALQSHGDVWRHGIGPENKLLFTMVKAALFSVSSYTALGLFFGARLNRPIVATVLFVAGIELFVSNLPVEAGLRAWSPTDAVRRLLQIELEPVAGSDFSQSLRGYLPEDRVREFVEPWTVWARVTATGLFLAVWTFSSREYAARAKD